MVYIYDEEFNLVNTSDIYTSLIWRRKYSACGDFELHVPLSGFNEFKEGYLIRKEADNIFGVIEYINIDTDEVGNEYLIAKGRMIDSYLSKRIVMGTYNFSNSKIEDIISSLFISQISNPSNIKRKIECYSWKGKKGLEESFDLQISYSNLLDVMEELCSSREIGFKTEFNFEEKKLYLECYKGIDRTISQKDNSQCIFSSDRDNIISQSYTLSTNEYKNSVLVIGEGSNNNTKIIEVGEDKSGILRNETVIEVTGINTDSISDNEYVNILREKGIIELSESCVIENFDATINPNGNLTYKKDWDLGDKVTFIDNQKGLFVDRRIVEVEEIYEKSVLQINLVVGEESPTIMKKIKRGNK